MIAADTGSPPDAIAPRLAAAAAAAIAMEIIDTEPGAERDQAVPPRCASSRPGPPRSDRGPYAIPSMPGRSC